jgi:hypothetical protein
MEAHKNEGTGTLLIRKIIHLSRFVLFCSVYIADALLQETHLTFLTVVVSSVLTASKFQEFNL